TPTGQSRSASGPAVQSGPAPEDHASLPASTNPEPGSGAVGRGCEPSAHEGTTTRGVEVRNAALMSKLLLNVFATGSGTVSATQLANWQSDAGHLRALLGGFGNGGGTADIQAALGKVEGDLVARMHLREVLAGPVLAARLTPSMS